MLYSFEKKKKEILESEISFDINSLGLISCNKQNNAEIFEGSRLNQMESQYSILCEF